MSIEHLRAGIDAHRAHQDAMAQVSIDIAAQRETEALASAALLVPPGERVPLWVDPSPDERRSDEHDAT